jgi:hypothetical protein
VAVDGDAVATFMIWLAQIQSRFRDAHVEAETTSHFTKVSTDIYPSRLSPHISMTLMAELRQFLGHNKQAVGIELILQKTADDWSLETSVGWSGRDVGWDTIAERIATSPLLESLFEQSNEMVGWAVSRFREQCAELPSLVNAHVDRQRLLEPLARLLRAHTHRSSAEERLLQAIDHGEVIDCTSPHLDLPASQLAQTFGVRRDVERQRRSTNNDPLWWGLDELVDALVEMGDERVHSQSAKTGTHDFLAFFTGDRVAVSYRALPR